MSCSQFVHDLFTTVGSSYTWPELGTDQPQLVSSFLILAFEKYEIKDGRHGSGTEIFKKTKKITSFLAKANFYE